LPALFVAITAFALAMLLGYALGKIVEVSMAWF